MLCFMSNFGGNVKDFEDTSEASLLPSIESCAGILSSGGGGDSSGICAGIESAITSVC